MTMPKQKPGRSKQDYNTPPEFIEAVMKRLKIDSFDCDLAADDNNALCDIYYTAEMSALPDDISWHWGSGWNWLNPPFDQIGKFAFKAAVQSRRGVKIAMLVPASVGANWFRDYVHGLAGVQVLFLNGRITFVGCKDPYPKDCMLVLYGGRKSPFHQPYDVWSWAK
jgi:phage N-6-adenine-methyltransferase